jgi:hypothetical protein
MSFTYRLPKVNADKAAYIKTPLAADHDLETGVLSLNDEDGNLAFEVKISDILGWKYDAYSAGVANIVEVDFSSATPSSNETYSLTVRAPYVVNFFGGGAHATADAQNSRAIYTTRTYTVSTDATATTAELTAAFVAKINADTSAYFSATDTGGSIMTIKAASAEAGPLEVNTIVSGAVIQDDQVWVSPVGTVSEVESELGVSVDGTGYGRFIIKFNDFIRHNAVKGLQAVKPSVFVYYMDKDDAGFAAAQAAIEDYLDGSHATAADYLGAPSL